MSEPVYTVHQPKPHSFVRTRDTVIYAPVYLADVLTAPSAGTVEIFNADNVLVESGDVAIVNSVASYTLSATTVADMDIESGWRVEWSLTIGSNTISFTNPAGLVEQVLYNVVISADLYGKVRALDPSGAAPITAETGFASQIHTAFLETEIRMVRDNKRPEWVRSPYSLRETVIYRALAIIFDDLASRLDEAYASTAESYHAKADAAYNDAVALFDANGDGVASTDPVGFWIG